jgi:hypothetical protein
VYVSLGEQVYKVRLESRMVYNKLHEITIHHSLPSKHIDHWISDSHRVVVIVHYSPL